MLNKKIPKAFYLALLICIMVIYNAINRWKLIESENYFVLEFFIYLFSIIFVIWAALYKGIKKLMFWGTTTLVLLATALTLVHFADTAKLYIDFIMNYQVRKEIAEKLVENYREELRTQEYADTSIYLGDKYKNLSTEGYVDIWRDRGCIEIDFEVYDGDPHGLIDFFNYGNTGHISYVTEVEKYNLEGGTIRNNIISTKKIYGNWYFSLMEY